MWGLIVNRSRDFTRQVGDFHRWLSASLGCALQMGLIANRSRGFTRQVGSCVGRQAVQLWRQVASDGGGGRLAAAPSTLPCRRAGLVPVGGVLARLRGGFEPLTRCLPASRVPSSLPNEAMLWHVPRLPAEQRWSTTGPHLQATQQWSTTRFACISPHLQALGYIPDSQPDLQDMLCRWTVAYRCGAMLGQ